MSLYHFVFVQHIRPACLAAMLSLFGAFAAWAAVRFGPQFVIRFPMLLFKMVQRLIGEHPGMMRMWAVIFVFNSVAMFVYMATGARPLFPEIIAFTTGFNITAILLPAGKGTVPSGETMLPVSEWVPNMSLAILCGFAVLVIELPCFWFSIGMGISLGREIMAGDTSYAQGVLFRAGAYALVIVPLLLVSAGCEVVAIRGMSTKEDFEEHL